MFEGLPVRCGLERQIEQTSESALFAASQITIFHTIISLATLKFKLEQQLKVKGLLTHKVIYYLNKRRWQTLRPTW